MCADADTNTRTVTQLATFSAGEISIAPLGSALASVQVVHSRQLGSLQNTFDQNAIYFWLLSSLQHTKFTTRCHSNRINTGIFWEHEKGFPLLSSTSPSLPPLQQHRACGETSQTQLRWNCLELTESRRQFSELHSTALVWSAFVRKIISLNPASLALISPGCQSLVALPDL